MCVYGVSLTSLMLFGVVVVVDLPVCSGGVYSGKKVNTKRPLNTHSQGGLKKLTVDAPMMCVFLIKLNVIFLRQKKQNMFVPWLFESGLCCCLCWCVI